MTQKREKLMIYGMIEVLAGFSDEIRKDVPGIDVLRITEQSMRRFT